MESDGFIGDLQREYNDFKQETRPPIWQFSGVLLILLLVGYGVYAHQQTKQQETAYLARPLAGDVYVYKTESGYSTMKVVEAFEDSVYVSMNEYETNKLKGIDEIDVEVHYPDDWYVLTVSEIQEMYDAGEIKDVKR
jgi:hypothetical protein